MVDNVEVNLIVCQPFHGFFPWNFVPLWVRSSAKDKKLLQNFLKTRHHISIDYLIPILINAKTYLRDNAIQVFLSVQIKSIQNRLTFVVVLKFDD